MIKTYISKPIRVKAMQLDSTNADEILNFSKNQIVYSNHYWGFTNNGFSMQFKNGDYVIDNNGNIQLMKCEQFENLYIDEDLDRTCF